MKVAAIVLVASGESLIDDRAAMVRRGRARRNRQQLVIGRTLLGVAEDMVRANELPETQRRIRVVGIGVGMGRLRGPSKSDPQGLGIIVRKGSEQIVERPHGGTHN